MPRTGNMQQNWPISHPYGILGQVEEKEDHKTFSALKGDLI